MPQYRSRVYQLDIATADGFHTLSGTLVGGSTLAAPTNVQQRAYMGADAARQYAGRTTFSLAINALEYGAELDAIRQANVDIAKTTEMAFVLSRDGYGWVGLLNAQPLAMNLGASDEVAVVTANTSGRRNLYGGRIEDTDHFDSTETGDYTLTRKPATLGTVPFTGKGRDQATWVVVRSGSATSNSEFEFSDGTVDGTGFSVQPGIYNAAALAVAPPDGFDRLKVSAAIGADTAVRIVYGTRVGRTR